MQMPLVDHFVFSPHIITFDWHPFSIDNYNTENLCTKNCVFNKSLLSNNFTKLYTIKRFGKLLKYFYRTASTMREQSFL